MESHDEDLTETNRRFAEQMFEYVQFLLDDDDHLTPTGNLSAAGRKKLRSRIDELVVAENPPKIDMEVEAVGEAA